jgi:gluconolactonase
VHCVIPFALVAVLAISPLHAQDRSPGSESQGQTSRFQRLNDRSEQQILVPGKHWDLLGEGYQLTADSAVDRVGNVYFTDNRNNRILKIDLEGKISTWKEPSNGAHGIAFGPDNRLYAGQHDHKRIVAFSSDGTERLIA